MIIDHISNASIYRPLGPRFSRAFDYLLNTDLDALPTGRVEVAGDELFAIVADGETKMPQQCRYEAHRQYHDIQLVTHGAETMGYAPVSRLKLIEDFVEASDYAFFMGEGDEFLVSAGWFALFMPQDAHRPSMAIKGRPQRVRKIVMKVAV
jgi:YhcH/YjgK/YiaL family protein